MKKTYPLTPTQYGLYVECMAHPEQICYNIPYIYTLHGSLDQERLLNAVLTAVAAHPTLFTRIQLTDNGEPQQTIDHTETFQLQVEQVDKLDTSSFLQPFPLLNSRLFRLRLLKDHTHYYLLQDIHHIICDGTSRRVLLQDIQRAYNGETLDPELLTLGQVAVHETDIRQTADFLSDKQWYAQHFDCSDCYSPLLPDLEDAEPEEALLTRQLKVNPDSVECFCKKNGIFKSTFFTAVYAYLLAKFNNEQEVLFSTIHNGRADKRLTRTVAMLVKTFPVYAKYTDHTTVLDFLKAMQDQMTGCRQHQAYGFSDVVADLNLQTATRFAWHGTLFETEQLCGLPMEARRLNNNTREGGVYVKAYSRDGHFFVETEYNASEYSETLISQFLESYEAVAEGFLAHNSLRDINITTKSQVELLDSFNQTDRPYDDTKTVVSLFRQQAKATPDNIAVVFKGKKYTYAEVDEISDRIAGYITSKGSGLEDVVSILIPRCEWMVIASLGVLKAGCAYQPLDPSYPKERLNFMMQDAGAKLLIADEELRGMVDEYQGEVLLTKDIEKLPALTEEETSHLSTVTSQLTPDRLFILLYTSGSTGVPKGCQLEHGNLVCFCHWYQRYYDLKPEHNVAAYASYGFDACMMDMYPALTCGASVYIIPEELRLDLIALNDYFEQNNITHSFMTTQVGYQFATSIENHSLKHLSVGGEKLTTLTPPTDYRFHNGYGPTECTIFTTTYSVDKKQKEIPIGKPVDNTHLYIVDTHGYRVPVGAAGELWISGPQVSRGYLNRPEKTAEVYINNPFTDEEQYSRVYRTGDIVRYLPDGNIQFVGRRDGQVKIRGFRIELKEVEAVIREFPGIKDATVQAFDEEGGGKFIAAYIVSDNQVDLEALNNFILDQKPPYMVPAVTMQIDAIPLNQNQKVNKKALPKPVKEVSGEGQEARDTNSPLNMLEQELKEMIAAIVGNADFGITTPLGYVGLTSITAIKLAVLLNKKYGIAVDAKYLANNFTLQTIENEIWKHVMSGATMTAQTELHERRQVVTQIPLSYAQMGVYADCMNNSDSVMYNIPMKVGFPATTDAEALAKAIRTVIKSHPQLSVHFDNSGDDIMQVTDPQQEVCLNMSQMTEEQLDTYKHTFAKPFDLAKGPLYRMEIVKTERRLYLLSDIHHLVADGGSYNLFFRQLCDVIDGKELEPEDLDYAGFVAAEKQAEKERNEAKAYFDSRLAGCEEATEIPADLTTPLERGTVSEVAAPFDMAAVEDYCQRHNITPAHLTLAATFYTLSQFANSNHLCMTTISSGRSNVRIANTMGMFVNTLALSAEIGDQTVAEFISETSEDFRQTLHHENYPFAQIAADYGLNPEIMFAYQIGVISHYSCQGGELEIENMELDIPKFRICIYIKECDGTPSVSLLYDNGRYSEALMQSMASSISTVISAFVRHPEVALKHVSLLNEKQQRMLDGFNTTDRPYDDTQTVVSLFRQQAKTTPDNIAVVFKGKKYTYAEVDEISDRIAGYIANKGSGLDDVVSILIPRCEWMVIASLGVLKAGCAYQPLDPSYPKERLNFMMQDAGAKLLIADEELRGMVDEYQGEVLLTKDIEKLPALTEEENSSLFTLYSSLKPDRLFILLYTSGSTGVPKGCQLTHANLVCYCHWYWKYYDIKPEHNVAEYASYGFDVHQEGIYPPLTCGATVHIIPEELRLDLVALNDYFEREHITHSFMTTQVGYQFATNIDNHSLLHLTVAGEKLASITPPVGYQLHNGYGPTEATIIITIYPLKKKETNVPIGKALDNVALYVVDSNGKRLPTGAIGELWVAGPQVAHGYLNRPEKQTEVFIDNPFENINSKYARVYRTGDIVRYLPDGNIQFVGRRDGQVKIRGFRVELKEVEAVIREFPGIKDATVQAFEDDNGGKYITAYVVSDDQVDIEALNNFILQEKPPYMVPAVTMQIDAIPLNQNQKVNKKALPKPEKSAAPKQLTEQAPLNVLEQELKEMTAAIVGNADFGITTTLGYVGLTSISAIKLAVQVNKRYGITLDARTLVKYGSLQSIENEILGTMFFDQGQSVQARFHETSTGQKEVDTDNSPSAIASYPLSYAQTGVYLDCLKNPTATLYNIPTKISFSPTTDANALVKAVKALVRKHPQLTVHYGNDETGFVQRLDNVRPVEVPVRQMSEERLAAYKNEFVRPFDLANDALYRFEIVATPQHVYLLMDVHHLIFDGASQDLFLRELCCLLDGGEVERESLSYAQYVLDEKKGEDGELFRQARDFFHNQLSAVEAATEVRPDLPHPVQGAIGKATALFDIEAVDRFCRAHEITPAHLLLSAVFYSLSRFAWSEELCITTVSNGRSDLRIHNTVGMFVNTLAITAKIGKQTVDEFLHEVSANFDATLRYENYPFAQIAADYGLTAEIQYVYQLGISEQYLCQGEALETESLELSVPKFPITFFIRHADGATADSDRSSQLDGCVCINYDDGKYSASLMQRLADAVTVTLERMMAKPEAALNSICIVSDAEVQRIIRLGAGKSLDVDLSKTFANLFSEQVLRTPDAPAVVDKDSQLSYGEMDRHANALARELINFGVEKNDFVCVMLDRVKEFPLSVLAIHKAGAAYTPLDFEYPNERLSYMLENSESKVLITSHAVLEAKEAEGEFRTAAAKTFFIDDFMAGIVSDDSAAFDPIDLSSPDGLAYMIYTSGSTGKPKGAILHQAGLRNFIAVVTDMEQLTAADRISGHRSFSFDAHIEDMYPILTLGGSFHIMPTEIRKDLSAIRQFLFDHQITGGGYSTAMTCLLLNAFDDLPIRFTTGGGEKMDGVYSDHIEIINVYGPTECTDDTSYYRIAPGQRVENIPIGQSVANNWNFIVDKAGHLLPQGVAGELCFAGIQVGRGYWRLPERTAQSFVACPFVSEDRWGRPVRMYHTGDLCRWNEDGQLEYLGRIDTQVKLRGFRIELGEIESKALNIEGIRQAAAEVRKVGGNEHLVLYYTVTDQAVIDDEALRTTLSNSSLADYMVPDVYMRMDAMPMTPNGKINRKQLPVPQLKRTVALEAPQGEMEELFCRIFADVLKMEEIGATDNFFEIGGTSINAIKVIVEAGKKGVQLVFNDLFSLKTPRALAAFVSEGQQSELPKDKTTAHDKPDSEEKKTSAVLQGNTLDAFRNGAAQPIGDVILTGATGYLGIHILNELLTHFDGQVICPIRAKNDEDASHRLKTLFFYYFGRTEVLASFDRRVKVTAAEVTKPEALDKLPYDGDLRTVTIINCVANVKHFSAGNDIETVNIESVRHLVAFCLRTGARLVHISTNSIAGISIDDQPGPMVKLTERNLNIGQNIDANKYVYSKYKAEELVLDAIEHHGLNAKIMRVGNLSARQKDGEFQINFNTNNFLATLRAYVVMGMVPFDALDRRFEFSPIDEVAHAIVLLAETPKECTVFHPNNIHRQYLVDIFTSFEQAGITLQRVEPEVFQEAWEKAMDNPELVTLLRPLVAYKVSGGHQVRWIESDNTYTTQVLYRLGFQWSVTSLDYIHRFIQTIIGFDYFSNSNPV